MLIQVLVRWQCSVTWRSPKITLLVYTFSHLSGRTVNVIMNAIVPLSSELIPWWLYFGLQWRMTMITLQMEGIGFWWCALDQSVCRGGLARGLGGRLKRERFNLFGKTTCQTCDTSGLDSLRLRSYDVVSQARAEWAGERLREPEWTRKSQK